MSTEKYPFPYYFYIITNKNKTVLYCGMTNNLAARLKEHESSEGNRKHLLANTIAITWCTTKVLTLCGKQFKEKKK